MTLSCGVNDVWHGEFEIVVELLEPEPIYAGLVVRLLQRVQTAAGRPCRIPVMVDGPTFALKSAA